MPNLELAFEFDFFFFNQNVKFTSYSVVSIVNLRHVMTFSALSMQKSTGQVER